MAHYADNSVGWVDNYEATYELTCVGFRRGRSAAYFEFESNGKVYPMFLKDLEQLILKGKIENGKVSGVFCFCKRGTNYGIQMVDYGKKA